MGSFRSPVLFGLFLVAFPSALVAQVDTSATDYVLLYDGTYIPGQQIGLESHGFGTQLQVRVDDRLVPARSVRGAHSSGHYYANLGHLSLGGSPRFVRRAFHGKLDLYEREMITVGLFYAYPSKLRYYSKDAGPVRNMTRVRLTQDLQDNAESMRHLRRGRTLTLVGLGMLLGGVTAIVVGNGQIDDSDMDAPLPVAIPFGGISASLCIVPFLLAPSQSRKAVRIYTGHDF